MRKHFYLMTEHEDPELAGAIHITDTRSECPNKNEEGNYTVFNEEKGEFRDIGRKVGCGYHDFEDMADYKARVNEVIRAKLNEIDGEWLEKAGVEGVTDDD